MDVTEEDYPGLVLLNEPPGMIDSWLSVLLGLGPLVIEISPSERTSKVPIDNPIWVQHWNDLENEIRSQDLGIRRLLI